jgi:hypothetical protein
MSYGLAASCLNQENNTLLNHSIDGGNNMKSIDQLFEQYLTSDYIDAHVNCFTPASFRRIMEALLKLGYMTLTIDSLTPTPEGSHEFSVVLKKA